MQLEFVDELPPDGRGEQLGGIVAALAENPNRWAIVGRFPIVEGKVPRTSIINSLRKRGMKVAQRRTDNGEMLTVYAMYPED